MHIERWLKHDVQKIVRMAALNKLGVEYDFQTEHERTLKAQLD